jgi:hypothetical protein
MYWAQCPVSFHKSLKHSCTYQSHTVFLLSIGDARRAKRHESMYCCHLLKSFISICALNDSVMEVRIISTRSCDLVQNLAFPCFIKELRIDIKYNSTHWSCIGTKSNLSVYQHDRRQNTHKLRPLYITCTSSRIEKWYLCTQTTTFIDCTDRDYREITFLILFCLSIYGLRVFWPIPN